MVRVAYYKGPPAIVYFGRRWRRGVPQPVRIEDWVAMNRRPDVTEFDFREEE